MAIKTAGPDMISVVEEGYHDNKTVTLRVTQSGRVGLEISDSFHRGQIAIITADDFKAIIEHLGAPQIAEILGLKVTS